MLRLGWALLLLAALLSAGLAQEDPAPPASQEAQTETQDAPQSEGEGEAAENEETPPAETVARSIPKGITPLSKLTLRREERTIIVNQYAPTAEGGEFVLNAPDCGEEAKEKGLRTHTVYGGDAFWVETLVNDTRLTSAIALVRKPDEGKEQEVLELFGGSLEVSSETKCPDNLELSEAQDVRLVQGRTTIDGYRFDYDNKTGVGKMKGPVKLDRTAEGDSPALVADASELEYFEETDETKLSGNVTIESDGRVSKADFVDFDDANSIAVLRGSPATSEKDGDLFQGSVITYFLDSNDVRVEGDIQGELEVDLGENVTTASGSAPEEGATDEGADPGEETTPDFVPEDFE